MTCEYCDSVLQEIPQNGRCPNCGGVLTIDVEQADVTQAVPESWREKEKRLRATDCAYCPNCLSTDVVRTYYPVFLRKQSISLIITIIKIIGRGLLYPHYKKTEGWCVCESCDYNWMVQDYWLKQRHQDYLEGWLNGYGCMTIDGIGKYRLSIESIQILIKNGRKAKYISMENLVGCEHIYATENRDGWMAFRDIRHRKKRFPCNLNEAKKDPYTIVYPARLQPCYVRLEDALRLIISDNKKEKGY